MKRYSPLLHTLIIRLLDVAIAVYAVMIPAVILTGGFKLSLLGLSLKASHIYTPLKILLPLIFLRLLISIDFKSLILLLASVAIGLVGIEFGIRLWNPPLARPLYHQLHRPSATYLWELTPGADGIGGFGEAYHVNAQGCRDYGHDRQRPDNPLRVMVIGDSFTFGQSVEMAQTYPARLEQALRERGIPAEVTNWGVGGYNMWQHIKVLENKVLPLAPDLIVLGVFFNDIGVEPPPGYGTPGFRIGVPGEVGPGWLARSAAWNLMSNLNFIFESKFRHQRGHAYLQGIEERHRHLGPENPGHPTHKLLYGKAPPDVYARFEKELERFNAAAQKAGVPVLVAMLPDAAQLHHPDAQAVNRVVAASAAAVGLPFVDVTPALEKDPDPRTLYLFPRDPHNSPKGYAIIGRRIAEAIVDYALLPTP